MANTPPAQQSAYDLLKSTLAAWGLSSLYNTAVQFLQKGYSSAQVQIELEQTKEYKQRFSGNELRLKEGLDTLSPAQYIAMEDQYRQIAKQFGLSPDFYGQAKLATLIGGDVSASEYQNRAQIALQTYTQAPQEYRDYWTKYGFTAGDAVSAILDPSNESLAKLQLQANAVQIGGTAAQNGIDVKAGRAMQLAENGVSLSQAQQAYQRIADIGHTDQQIAQRYGTTFNTTDEENDLLLGSGAAAAKRGMLYNEETAQFRGRGGDSTNTVDSGANY